MGRGVNKVILVGNCGGDPEVRYSPEGTCFANVSIATSESWKDKQTGQQQERTEWHRVSFAGKLAEIVGEYVTKGSKLYIEGKLHTRKWQDKQGNDQYTTEVRVREMQMLDSRGGASDGSGNPGSSQGADGSQSSPQAAPNQGDFDDDIPF